MRERRGCGSRGGLLVLPGAQVSYLQPPVTMWDYSAFPEVLASMFVQVFPLSPLPLVYILPSFKTCPNGILFKKPSFLLQLQSPFH